MPTWALLLLKAAMQLGGPLLLNFIKKWLEGKFPEYAKIIEELINDLLHPEKSNSIARKQALQKCDGIACPPELKRD